MKNGGERGIRTPGTLARSTVFETAPFNHSGTSPRHFEKNGSQVARNIDKLRTARKSGFQFFTSIVDIGGNRLESARGYARLSLFSGRS